MNVIGLTGRNASGKGEVARLLTDLGFEYGSLSDVLRQELRARGDAVSRDNLIAIGRELRGAHGSAVLAQRMQAGLNEDGNYVVDSFRHPNEVEWFQTHQQGFVLWEVHASEEIRFERICSRGRESDPTTMESFRALEQAEATRTQESGQDLDGTAALADRVIPNEQTFQELRRYVEAALRDRGIDIGT